VSREEVAELLQRFGVTPTNQRLDVGQVILSRPQHLSADQIISAVQHSGSRVSKATVYNTLNLFCERGLLRTVNVDPTRQFYDPTTSNHHHFYNEDTGVLADIAPDAIEFKRMPELPVGTQASGVEVVMRIRNSKPA
jgi:Fur family iron response transcriptional regulator